MISTLFNCQTTELAAEFQIQLAAELGNPVPDVLGLKLHIFLIVETDPGHERPPSWCRSARKNAPSAPRAWKQQHNQFILPQTGKRNKTQIRAFFLHNFMLYYIELLNGSDFLIYLPAG